MVEVLFARKANPFVFAAARVELVRGSDGWRDKVRQLGADVVGTACVEDSEISSFTNPPGTADLRLDRTSPQAFTVDVDAKGPHPSFIAVNQTWDSNWHVTLDGQPVRLVRTDLALSGAIVPPGSHRLVFEYGDAWVAAGMGASAGASACALLALLIARRQNRRRAPGEVTLP